MSYSPYRTGSPFNRAIPIRSQGGSRNDESDATSRTGSPYVALGGSPHVGSPFMRQRFVRDDVPPASSNRNGPTSSRNPNQLAISIPNQSARFDSNFSPSNSEINGYTGAGSLPATLGISPRKPKFSDISTYSETGPVNVVPAEQPDKGSLQSESSVNGSVVDTEISQDIPAPLFGYLVGQIANVVKAGVWWVGFSPLILALFGGPGDSLVVGYARIAFNLSMLLLSPIAGGVVEKISIKKLLNISTLGRGLVYGLLLPVAWIGLYSELAWQTTATTKLVFKVLFVGLVLVDGVIVAFANIADVDSGGTDLVASQCGIEVTDNLRNKFNALHIMFFDGSMMIFAPALAGLGLLFATQSDTAANTADIDSLAVLGCMATVFILCTIVSMYYYSSALPSPSATGGDLPADAGESGASACSEIRAAIVEGFKMTWAHSRIRYRVLFFALEVALEDAMISLVISQYANMLAVGSKLPYAYGNLWAAGIVAVAKIGGVLTSVLMGKCFSVDPEAPAGAAYRPLFYFVAAAGICSLGVPASVELLPQHRTAQLACVVASCFLFFLFSTVGKIGFATLMQSLAAEFNASGRVFGFLAVAVTATDALVLMGLSAVFARFPLTTESALPLWICCGVVAFHGIVECVFGPCLILRSDRPDEKKSLLASDF